MFIFKLLKKSSDWGFSESPFLHPKKKIILNKVFYQMIHFIMGVTILSWTQLVYEHCISHIGEKARFSTSDNNWGVLPKTDT